VDRKVYPIVDLVLLGTIIHLYSSLHRSFLLGISTAAFMIVRIPAWKNLLKELSLVFKEKEERNQNEI